MEKGFGTAAAGLGMLSWGAVVTNVANGHLFLAALWTLGLVVGYAVIFAEGEPGAMPFRVRDCTPLLIFVVVATWLIEPLTLLFESLDSNWLRPTIDFSVSVSFVFGSVSLVVGLAIFMAGGTRKELPAL